jgi:hypothetical protein
MTTKISRLIFVSIFMIFFLSASAQPYRFGKISKEEWEIGDCSFDCTAEAIILHDVGMFEYEFHVILTDEDLRTGRQPFNISFTRHMRIKLLTDHNEPETYLKIPLYLFPEKKHSLNTFKALLVTRDGKRSKNKKYKRKDLTEITDEVGLVYLFELDNLPGGSILDIEYRLISNYLYHIPEWSFGSKYPTLYSKISYSIPNFMDVSKQIEIIEKLNKKTSMHPSDPLARHEYNAFNFIYEEYELENISSVDVPFEPNILRCYVSAVNIGSISRHPEPVRFYYYIPPSPIAK